MNHNKEINKQLGKAFRAMYKAIISTDNNITTLGATNAIEAQIKHLCDFKDGERSLLHGMIFENLDHYKISK